MGADGTTYVVGRTDSFGQVSYIEDILVLKILADGRGTEARMGGGPDRDLGRAVAFGPNGDLYIVGGASSPPYSFDVAPPQMSRVRGAAAMDADGIVETPAGTLGTPEGTVSALNGTVTTDEDGAVLLRVRPA